MSTWSPRAPAAQAPAPSAWWREPMVWLVITGPVAVVIAGFITLAIAIRNPDPVVPDTAVRAGSTHAAPPGTAAPSTPRDTALMPAMQARNQGAAEPRTAP